MEFPTHPTFTYYCDVCEEIIVLSRRLIEAHKVFFAFKWRCPACKANLKDSLQCGLIETPVRIDLFINPKFSSSNCLSKILLSHDRAYPLLRFLSSSMGVNEQIRLGGVEGKPLQSYFDMTRVLLSPSGRLMVFFGNLGSHRLAEVYAVEAQFLNAGEGSDVTIVFIDGGGVLDSYLILEHALRRGLDPYQTLDKILISRVFTCYKQTSLIIRKLPKIVERRGVKLIVIYCDLRHS